MSCSPIIGLVLDQQSQAALEQIKKNKTLAKGFAAAFTIGNFHSIFTKNKSPIVALNITQNDWSMYGQVMSSLPKTQKNIIIKLVDKMIVHYHLGKYDYKHVQFWKGMKYGCR